MRTITVKIIIFIASFALLGLALTQTFWIRGEIMLGQRQFDHRADNALVDVVKELNDFTGKASRFTPRINTSTEEPKNILDVIDTSLVRTLIKKYVGYHRLDENYSFAILKTSNDSVIYQSGDFTAASKNDGSYKACLSSVWQKDYYHLALHFPHKNKAVVVELFLWLILTILFLIIITLSVAFIIITYLRQKKLSEMKNDFINNITHEFKTPISTIALASEMLMKSDNRSVVERIKKYAGIIYDENERMRLQVERVLQMARQDHQEIQVNPVEVHLHEMLESVINNFRLEKTEKDTTLQFIPEATQPVIMADEMFLTGVISNILDNAIKYSGNRPEITVKTKDHKEGILISVIDRGMGMGRDVQKHVFDKFFRAHTGNVHNVKGFGLGLYYAKIMTEAHGGSISVTSELNKGSRFDVYIPATPKILTRNIA
jgi:two-component system phosphate regulon sensor histidine kinase PhoR